MPSPSSRSFDSSPASRTRVPLWIGLVGSSGSGKTFSALRLATGMSKVYGDGVFIIDTEARRSAHYADQFRYTLVDFKAPFGPQDYLAAVRHCIDKGARTIVIDSMSHEWEGAGGVLEQHDAECDRLVAQWQSTRDKVQMSAWQRPKTEHRRLLNEMLQSGVNFINCYRAKEKLKIVRGKDPVALGWQPVAPDDFVYEATINILLYPGSRGVPAWQPAEDGEKALIKLPGHFTEIFRERRPLDEATGEALAKWAAGTTAPDSRATQAEIRALIAQLVANGLKDGSARAAWIIQTIGHPIAKPDEMTESEVSLCMQAAKEAA